VRDNSASFWDTLTDGGPGVRENRLCFVGVSLALSSGMLAYERLDVYGCAVQFLALASELLDAMPSGNVAIRDQLDRASLSVTNNIAEAVGVRTSKERERHLGIARGSAMKCGALLDACRLRRLCSVEQARRGKELLVRVVSMLTKMIAS
jgi:four helix bundle protein